MGRRWWFGIGLFAVRLAIAGSHLSECTVRIAVLKFHALRLMRAMTAAGAQFLLPLVVADVRVVILTLFLAHDLFFLRIP